MKKLYGLYGSIGLLSTMMFAGCSGKVSESNDSDIKVEFESFSYDVIAQYPDSLTTPLEGGDYCRIKGQGMLPVKIGNHDVENLRDSLRNLTEVVIIDRKVSQPILEDGLVIVDSLSGDTTACSIKINELSVDLLTPQLVVWKNYSYIYQCGAAHGMYNTIYVNYSITNNEVLQLSDIFNPGYEETLGALIRDKIKEDNIEIIVPLEEISIPNDFRVTTNGIDFIYQLYEIAPYSSGEIKVELAKYELSELFKPGTEELLGY